MEVFKYPEVDELKFKGCFRHSGEESFKVKSSTVSVILSSKPQWFLTPEHEYA